MKLICKDYYRYSTQPKLLKLFKRVFNNDQEIRISLLNVSNFIPFSVFLFLSQDKEWRVREAIALRSDAPLAILDKLYNDPRTWVRDSVENNSIYKDYLNWTGREYNVRDKYTYERSIEDYIRYRSRYSSL